MFHLGVAQNESARPQVLVSGSRYKGTILEHVFEPQPFGFRNTLLLSQLGLKGIYDYWTYFLIVF